MTDALVYQTVHPLEGFMLSGVELLMLFNTNHYRLVMCNIPKNYRHCNIFTNTDIVSNLNISITDINIYRIVNI